MKTWDRPSLRALDLLEAAVWVSLLSCHSSSSLPLEKKKEEEVFVSLFFILSLFFSPDSGL